MCPVMFKIFGVDIYSYFVILFVSYIICLFIAMKRGEKKGIKSDIVFDLSLYLLIFGILGSRLLFVLLNLKNYLINPIHILYFREGGLTWHGAAFGGALTIIIYCYKKKIPSLLMFDIMAPSFILGVGLGKIGCFLNGCCLGKVAQYPWCFAIQSTNSPLHRHPVQIYELILELIGFLFLIYYDKFTKFRGELFWTYVILYSLIRFSVEFFRESEVLCFGMSLAQVVSIIFIVIAFIIILINKIKLKTFGG